MMTITISRLFVALFDFIRIIPTPDFASGRRPGRMLREVSWPIFAMSSTNSLGPRRADRARADA